MYRKGWTRNLAAALSAALCFSLLPAGTASAGTYTVTSDRIIFDMTSGSSTATYQAGQTLDLSHDAMAFWSEGDMWGNPADGVKQMYMYRGCMACQANSIISWVASIDDPVLGSDKIHSVLGVSGIYFRYDDDVVNGVDVGGHKCGGPGIYRRMYMDFWSTSATQFAEAVVKLQDLTSDGYVECNLTRNRDGSGAIYDDCIFKVKVELVGDARFLWFKFPHHSSHSVRINYDFNGGTNSAAPGTTGFNGYRMSDELFGYPDLVQTMSKGDLLFAGWYKTKAGADNLDASQKVQYWDRFTSDTTIYAGYEAKAPQPWFDVVYHSPDGRESMVLGKTVGKEVRLDGSGNFVSEEDLDVSRYISGDEYFLGYFDGIGSGAHELAVGDELTEGDQVYLHTVSKTQLNFTDRKGRKLADMDMALGYPIGRFNADFPEEVRDREFATAGGRIVTIDSTLTASDFGPNDTAASVTLKETGVDRYTVTFDGNGGRMDGEPTASVIRDDGSAVGSLPFPSHGDREFLGWYTLASGGTRVGADTVVTRDVTYYARWGSEKVTVTFDANGGTLYGDPSLRVAMGSVIGTLPTVTRDGYRFAGWYTAVIGGTQVTGLTQVNQNLTVYARWERIEHSRTVTFDPCGGQLLERYRDLSSGDPLGPLPVVRKAGYDLVGWYTEVDGGTAVTEDTAVMDHVTFYARWKPVEAKKTVETLTLNKTSLEVDPGDDLDLRYTFVPMDAENAMFYWTSSHPEVIRVSGEVFQYVGTGKTTLTLHTLDGSREASVDVTVRETERKLTAVSFLYPRQTVVQGGGETLDLSYRFGPPGAVPTDFVFESSDPDVVSVSRDGKTWSFGTKTGTVDIRIHTVDGSVSDVLRVTVLPEKGPEVPDEVVYDVTFRTLGGDGIPSMFVAEGDMLELPVPARKGYDFLGWYLADGEAAGTSVRVTSDLVLYAKWMPSGDPDGKIYTVTYHPQNGNPFAVVDVADGDVIGVMPSVNRDGYRFLGWFTEPEGGRLASPEDPVVRNLHLYARWESLDCPVPRYDLQLYPNGGYLDGSSKTMVLSGMLQTGSFMGSDLSGYRPERPGYVFTGWYSAGSCGMLLYDSRGRAVDSSYWDGDWYLGTSDLPLYAGWAREEPDEERFTLSFDTGCGQQVQAQEYAAGTVVDGFPHLAREGYRFKGWSMVPDGELVSSVMMDVDITLHAVWEEAPEPVVPDVMYVLSYDARGGDPLDPVTYQEGTVVSNLPVPVRDGYGFLGWFDDAGNLMTKVTMDRDLVLYADWKELVPDEETYQVVLDANYPGGSVRIYTVPAGTSILGLSDVFVRDGYRFTGWFDSPEGGNRVTDHTGPENITLYAHWEALPEVASVRWTLDGKPVADVMVDVNDASELDRFRYEWEPREAAVAGDFGIRSSEPDVVSVGDTGQLSVEAAGKAELWVVFKDDDRIRDFVSVTVTDMVGDAEARIAAIGTVTASEESKALITEAREAYDSLSVDLQELVANRDVLSAAEREYERLSGSGLPDIKPSDGNPSGEEPSDGKPSGNGMGIDLQGKPNGSGTLVPNGSSDASDKAAVRNTGKDVAASSVATADMGALSVYGMGSVFLFLFLWFFARVRRKGL